MERSGLSYSWLSFHQESGLSDGWELTLPVLLLLMGSITAWNTSSYVSAPHGKHLWEVPPRWGRPTILLVQPMSGWCGKPIVLACGWLDEWFCICSADPVTHFLTLPCGWACESNDLGLGWVVEARTSTSHQSQSLQSNFYQSLLWVSGACLSMERIVLFSLVCVPHWSEWEKGELSNNLNI